MVGRWPLTVDGFARRSNSEGGLAAEINSAIYNSNAICIKVEAPGLFEVIYLRIVT